MDFFLHQRKKLLLKWVRGKSQKKNQKFYHPVLPYDTPAHVPPLVTLVCSDSDAFLKPDRVVNDVSHNKKHNKDDTNSEKTKIIKLTDSENFPVQKKDKLAASSPEDHSSDPPPKSHLSKKIHKDHVIRCGWLNNEIVGFCIKTMLIY